MSEKLQKTKVRMIASMKNRYGEIQEHKHNKNHRLYRCHHRSHPVQIDSIISDIKK